MYANKLPRPKLHVLYYCQECEENFRATDTARHCPYCADGDRSNLVIMHLEEDSERALYLELVDFAAGD